MVVMCVAEEKAQVERRFLTLEKFLAERNDARAGVKDEAVFTSFDFDTRRVAAISKFIRVGDRITASNAPKADAKNRRAVVSILFQL